MGDLRLVQFGDSYDRRQINTMVDILEKKFSSISSSIFASQRAAYQIKYDLSSIGNVGGGEDTLISYTLPANSIAKDGYSLQIKAWGTVASNANNKTIKLYFGSSIYDTGIHSVNGGYWVFDATISRVSNTSQQAITVFSSSNSSFSSSVNYVDPAQTLSTGIIIKCTGTGTSDNDIVQHGLLVRLFPQE